jgi:hypothetical protein
MAPVDYSVKPPIIPPPPPPPPRGGASRFALPFTLLTTLWIVVYVYRNNQNDATSDYWRKMESGQIVLMGEEVDGDDDDEDDLDEA